MNETEKITVTVWRRDNQYWIIPGGTYNGIALDRHSFERCPPMFPIFDRKFAQLNAWQCGQIESLYVLRKFYSKYNLNISLVLE